MVEASIRRMQSTVRESFVRRTHGKLTKVQELLLKRFGLFDKLIDQQKKKAAHLVRTFCKDYASTSQFKTILKNIGGGNILSANNTVVSSVQEGTTQVVKKNLDEV